MPKQKKIKICKKCGEIIKQGHNCKSADGLKTYNSRLWAGKQFETNIFASIKTNNGITYLASGNQLNTEIIEKEKLLKIADEQIKALQNYKKSVINCGSPSI
jgi:hypothetical protein